VKARYRGTIDDTAAGARGSVEGSHLILPAYAALGRFRGVPYEVVVTTAEHASKAAHHEHHHEHPDHAEDEKDGEKQKRVHSYFPF
jgi:hypothetical protein